MKKRVLVILLVMVYMVQASLSVIGQTDLFIETDEINQVYNANPSGNIIIGNLQFNDISTNHWAQEAVSRLGALEIIKGYPNGSYGPSDQVSKEVALTMMVRAIGMEADAILAAETIALANPGSDIIDVWSRGYMQIASNIGLITPAELADALTVDQVTLDPETDFIRGSAVTREQIAVWLVNAIGQIDPNLLPPLYTLNTIYDYTDVSDITAEYGPYIEAVTAQKIMQGNNNRFNPKGELTRAELAQIMKNLDTILFDAMGYARFTGVVGKINDISTNGVGTTVSTREILVRNQDGLVDQFNYSLTTNEIGKTTILDTPVLRGSRVGSLKSLQEGEEIEYIVDPLTNTLLYVYRKGGTEPYNITGQLEPLTDLANNKLSIMNNGVVSTYTLSAGLYDSANTRIRMADIWYKIGDAPVDQYVTLTLQENIIMSIEVTPGVVLFQEVSGIVKSINTTFKYITITDWNGNEVTKNYTVGALTVEKQFYYDDEDEIGYIDEMFPDFRFDERDATIDTIEVGDIVHMRLNPSNLTYVTAISAKTNYVVKYGTVKEVNHHGAEGSSILVNYEDGATAFSNVDGSVPIKKQGNNVNMTVMQPGDTIRMLVNQAVINPGTITESIKEIVIDAYGNQVVQVYRGKLGTLNQVQEQISLISSYTLGKVGWANYKQAVKLDFGKEVSYFYNGAQITLSYALNYLSNSNLEVYVVTENYYGSEVARLVSIRDGRDSVIDYSNITYSNGFDTINLLSLADDISVDPGTIVIKNNRLVEIGNIMSPDYAQIILNGSSSAAIVNIEPEPSNDAIDIFRGRIATINDGNSFKVLSHASLMDMAWLYSPIERVFTIDYDTVIIDENGPLDLADFISYSDISQVDAVYTIIADGDYASHIIMNPYAQEGVTGEIYDVANGQIMIKDVMVYASATGLWDDLSFTNSYAQVNLLDNSIIIKNNEVISVNQLEDGDQIRILTTEDLQEKLLLSDTRDVNGYIILVER
ncbi:MAG: S-layer homology domain-containing protein [Vallitaleaceae bacterium]|nr:S-layer homology domain-containing protein [Vallitaleaceae bacterium]